MINWISTEVQPGDKTHVKGLLMRCGGEDGVQVATATLWHEIINGTSIYYDLEGFQVTPVAWKPIQGDNGEEKEKGLL